MFGQTPHSPRSNTSAPTAFPATTEGWARRYASLGFPVVVLRPGTKAPALGRGWSRKATTDPDEAARQVAAHPGCNLAVLLGAEVRPGRYTALLDIDKGGRRTLRTLLRKGSPLRPLAGLMLRTAAAQTGRGGRHYWLLLPFRVEGVLRLGKGLELKGAPTGKGGPFAVVEPSVTVKEYVWTYGPWQDVAEVPAPLARLLCPETAMVDGAGLRPVRPAPAPRRASDDSEQAALAYCLERWPILSEGERNDRQASVLAYLVAARLYDRETTLRVAEAWLESFAGVFATRRPEALAHLRAAEGSARKSLATGGLQHTDGHVERIAAQALEPWQEELVWGLGNPKTREHSPWGPGRPGLPVALREGLCRTEKEAVYVEAWLLLARYKLLETEEPALLATREQIQGVIELRHGRKFLPGNPNQYERLQRKFVERPGRPASRCPLLVRTVEGFRRSGEAVGVPSAFEVEALAWLLVAEPYAPVEPEGLEPADWRERLAEAEAWLGYRNPWEPDGLLEVVTRDSGEGR